MCRVRRLLRTLCLELTRLCHKYHHQRTRDHQNGTDAGLGFWVIGLPNFFCIFVRFCCEQAYKSNRFRTYPALRVLPGGNQVDGLPPAFSKYYSIDCFLSIASKSPEFARLKTRMRSTVRRFFGNSYESLEPII